LAASNSTTERLVTRSAWDDATKDFSIKKVYLWASPDTRGKLQTHHACMQPAFFAFGDRFVEGTYLCSDSATPCIWMFSINLQLKIKVQDFKFYLVQFPFKEPSCPTRNTPTMMKEMSKMHEENAHDNNLIAMETSNQIHTRAQMRAAENVANSHMLEPADVSLGADARLERTLAWRGRSVGADASLARTLRWRGRC